MTHDGLRKADAFKDWFNLSLGKDAKLSETAEIWNVEWEEVPVNSHNGEELTAEEYRKYPEEMIEWRS